MSCVHICCIADSTTKQQLHCQTLSPANSWERKCADTIGTVPIQLAQCRFPRLAISSAKILIYFSNKIYRSNFYQTPLGSCYGLKLPKFWLQLWKKIIGIYYNFWRTLVPCSYVMNIHVWCWRITCYCDFYRSGTWRLYFMVRTLCASCICMWRAYAQFMLIYSWMSQCLIKR